MSFDICLNTSTLRGHDLDLGEIAEIAAAAGYRGIEPWMREVDAWEAKGGSLDDLGRRIRDLGLAVPSAIDFFEWIVDDPERRRRGVDAARRSMERLARLGGTGIAAAPAGADGPIGFEAAAERYRALLEIAEGTGVVPILEFWGKSAALSRLGQAVHVALEARHPAACVLADVYHLYKGGSGIDGIRRLQGSFIGCFHLNDYPAEPTVESIEDADRVFPGDGVAPLGRLFDHLRTIGYRGMLSLELFNRSYWARPARDVAREGLEKSLAAIERGA